MVTTLDEQINQLKQAIADLEAQRPILGEEAVEAALVPSRQKLAELEAQVSSSLDTPQLPTRKRKLVTLLYLDIVGSTAMTQHLDPEDTMEIMDHALMRMKYPIDPHGGHVTRYTGDGFKAIFGDPIAREDDPEQAIRAGLEILELSKVLSQEIKQEWEIEDFQVRIGIDTGLAALGGLTEAEDTVKGRVVNLAVRIESAAPPGGLLISHNTYRHVRGVFNVDPQEPISAKGFPEPVPVYLVREIKPRAFHVQSRGVEGIETRMVGRETEHKYLQDALLTAIEEGEGQVVTISGEAGVGKSRLLYEFQNWIELLPPSHGVRFFQGRGRQESRGMPYSLLRDLFAFRFQVLDDDRGEQARQKIEAGFCEVFGTEEDDLMRAHILGQLLGFDFSASPHLKGVLKDAEQLRNRAQMYLVQYFQAISGIDPLVVFLEDLHWADDSSLDMVMRLGEFAPDLPLLIVGAARPLLFERRPNWITAEPYYFHLELHPLQEAGSHLLIEEILKLAKNIPTELQNVVINKAEGNPFYMEEIIKMLIEDGVIIPSDQVWGFDLTHFEKVDVPPTLAGVLQARLERLPLQERTVLQQASVVGRLFWDRIVAYIQAEGGNGGDPALIPIALASLRNRELVYRHEESVFAGTKEYLFKHDVLREVTYESVPKRQRIKYHALVADWLIHNSEDRISEYSGLIAEHLLLAGEKEIACNYFIQAGISALDSYANSEAEGYFRQALNLSPNLSLQARLLTGLGEALSRKGETKEAKRNWRQAIGLYQNLEDYVRLADVYARLSQMICFTDNLEAWNICQEGLELMINALDSRGYARLLAVAGRTAYFVNLIDQVAPLGQRAMEMSQRVGDIEVEAEARITLLKENDDEAIGILEEVVELTEREGVLRSAARAHIAIAWYLTWYLIDLESSLQHRLRAFEIYLLIGDFDNIMLLMLSVAEHYIELGKFENLKEKLLEINKGIPDYESRVNETLNNIEEEGYLSHAKGEWFLALDARQARRDKLTKDKTLEHTVKNNIWLAETTLEIKRFEQGVDLSDAEHALMENIEIDWGMDKSHFLLPKVWAWQGRLEEVRCWLSQEAEDQSQFEKYLSNAFHLSVEYDLAFAEGRWPEAVTSSEKLLDVYRKFGHRWWEARLLIDLGDALVGRNEPDDLERARDTYQQSLDIFTEMGAPGYIKVLEERLGEL